MPKYDLAVIGAGLGGLAAAALASRMNKKTIVLESTESAGGVVCSQTSGGFIFFPETTITFGFERGGTLQKMTESLGLAMNASVLSPCYQVALPNRRITVYADHQETLEELSREFPAEIDAISRFYRDIRKKAGKISKNSLTSYLATRRSARGFIRRYHFSSELKVFFDVQSRFFFRMPVENISLGTLVTLFDSTPLTVHGGFKKFANQLVDVILKNGGEIRYQVPLASMTIKDGRPLTLTTSVGNMESDAILLNTERREKDRALFFGIRDEVVPLGMLQNVLCVPDYAQPERFFSLSLGDKDHASAPKGMQTLSAAFHGWSIIKDREEMVREVRELIPFLDDFTLCTEECPSVARSKSPAEGMPFKSPKSGGRGSLLSRSGKQNIFMIIDGAGTPLQSIMAAQEFSSFFK